MSQIEPYGRPADQGLAPRPAAWSHAPSYQPGPIATDRRDVGGGVLAIAWILAVLSLGYMLPWAIAASRGKANHGSVGLINALLGWSFIGWVVALVMACQAHQVAGPPMAVNVMVAQNFPHAQFNGPPPPPQAGPPPGWYGAPDGIGRQYWDGRTWTGHRAP